MKKSSSFKMRIGFNSPVCDLGELLQLYKSGLEALLEALRYANVSTPGAVEEGEGRRKSERLEFALPYCINAYLDDDKADCFLPIDLGFLAFIHLSYTLSKTSVSSGLASTVLAPCSLKKSICS
mmetsp:Transcript_14968/g.33708  ORF Transcript_14968/g.33708 Transcript_14968/m.33708 type:complete len:124 (+) Transcript_14968:1300-1671(+)